MAILPLPNLVFFPNTVIPMLIVEPSYVNMIKDCLITDQCIGISMAEPIEDIPGPTRYTPSRVATMGKPVLLEENDDGSIKIIVRGEERVELLSVEQNIPYLIYKAKVIPDIRDGGTISFETPQISRLKEILSCWVDETIDDSLERESFYDSLETLHHIIDYLSMFMIQDRLMRQIILENRSLQERIQMLSSLLKGEQPECEDFLVAHAMKDFEFGELEQKVMH